eukprot:scaffold1975_cov54-Attheya_sp.AAC.6
MGLCGGRNYTMRLLLLFALPVVSSLSLGKWFSAQKERIMDNIINGGAKVQDKDQQHRDLIEWIRSHPGGFVHEHLEIRLSNPEDPASGYGLFVKDNVTEGEVLYSVPWDLILKPDDFEAYDPEFLPFLSCGTIRALIHEVKLGDKSNFGPYLKDFHSWEREHNLPSDWSVTGQNLFGLIVDDEFPPFKFRSPKVLEKWVELCGGSDDPLEEKAALFVATRAEDYFLIPLFELVNHRNGNMNHKHTNKRIDVVNFERADGVATRDIAAGEEVYYTYYMCDKCGEFRTNGYGVADVFQTFGFVESMPQRWFFGDSTFFDLDYTKDGQELELRWFDLQDYMPTEDDRFICEADNSRRQSRVKAWSKRYDSVSASIYVTFMSGNGPDIPLQAQFTSIAAKPSRQSQYCFSFALKCLGGFLKALW